jgi:alpha-tubulin suppressor-like RCC1 family protein
MGDRFPGGVISKTPPAVSSDIAGSANIYVWGSNAYGRLGLAGSSSQVIASGVWSLSEVLGFKKGGLWPAPVDTAVNRSSPVPVGSLTNWAQVSVSSRHSNAIKGDGTLWAWGGNYFGTLGINLDSSASRSSPVQVGALTNWAQVSAGLNNTAAITTSGQLYAWGRGLSAGTGDGTTIDRSSPVQIGALTNWAQVSVGGYHTASVKTDGTLWAWGNNGFGRLGDGTVLSRSSPVQIGALTNWAQVSAGSRHTASVKTDGTVWAWGSNFAGQIGDGTVINRSSPVQVGALTNWAQVSAGGFSTASVKTDGTVWAWGSNFAGQIGDGTVINRSSPVQVGALTDWVEVSIAYHTLARTTG